MISTSTKTFHHLHTNDNYLLLTTFLVKYYCYELAQGFRSLCLVGPLVAVLYLLVGSAGCGGYARVLEERMKKVSARAGEGIFFGNGFPVCIGFHRVCRLAVLDDFPGALSFCDVCVSVRVLL